MDDPAVLAAAPATPTSSAPLTHPGPSRQRQMAPPSARPSLGATVLLPSEQWGCVERCGVAGCPCVGDRVPAARDGVADGQ